MAPSPDWFAGVPWLALKRAVKWTGSETVTLNARESGINIATTYKAEKIAVNPFVPITLYDAPMLLQMGTRIPVPVGTAMIRRIARSLADRHRKRIRGGSALHSVAVRVLAV